jgi:O-antigen/teichoic acid export membrane protein
MSDRIFSTIKACLPERWAWIFEHEGLRRYSENTGWLFLGQVFSLLVSFFIGVWLARYLGPQQYGIASYVVSFVGLFSFISYLGVDGILSRELINYPESRDALLGTSFRLKLAGGCLAFLAASAAAFLIKTDPFTRLLIFLYASTFIFQAASVISIFFQARVESRSSVLAQLFATLISAGLKIFLIVSGQGLLWLIVIYMIEIVVQALAYFSAYRLRGFSCFAWRFDHKLAGEIWRGAWPLMLSGAAYFVYLKVDQVMIGRMMGESPLGLYAAAVRVVEAAYFIPLVFSSSLFPAIVNAKKNNTVSYRRRLRNFYGLMLALALLIAIPVSGLSGYIVDFLFGAPYAAAAPILRIYVWSDVGLFVGWAASQHLLAESRTKLIFLANLLALSANVGLNLWLIPNFGLVGAAWASLMSYLAIPVIVVGWTWFRSLRRVSGEAV